MPKPILSYLFEAEYNDGSTYTQNPEDASIKFPPEIVDGQLHGKSCFTDIREDVAEHKIKQFSLIGRGNVISVNLQTGLFSINDVPVLLESEKLPALPEFFELIYYRQVTVNARVNVGKGAPELQKTEQSDIFVEFFIGWKCNIGGREYIQKLAVS